ncbi:metal ABC transporter permease [Candidatus Woesearchaeota archaeon]|nr:MAG: metal ABC transporter permease [Candidatus Woesearchaeota archaeon]
MLDILGYGFMQRALISGTLLALAASLLGVFLVLKRHALIGHGLAHISFGGIAVGLLFGVSPFLSALVFGVLGAFGIVKARERTRLEGDASIGLFADAALGLGVLVASIANAFNIDIMSYLFGSILAISPSEVILSSVLAATVILFVVLFYNELFVLTFDEETAKVSGINVDVLNSLLVFMTAVTVVSAMRVVGLLLVSALLVFPYAASVQVAKNFRETLVIAAFIAVASVLGGIFVSYYLDWAASGTIVLLLVVSFFLSRTVRRFRNPDSV